MQNSGIIPGILPIIVVKGRYVNMTNLRCSVYTCTHHKADMCCKPNIKVGTPGAQTADETTCVSYAPKGNENNVGYSTPNGRLEIVCSATECVHNKDKKCAAGSVAINTMGGNAGCSTFKRK